MMCGVLLFYVVMMPMSIVEHPKSKFILNGCCVVIGDANVNLCREWHAMNIIRRKDVQTD